MSAIMRAALEQIAILAEYNTTGPGSCRSDALSPTQATALRLAISTIARQGIEDSMITTQRALRRLFWIENPDADRRRITDYAGTGRMYTTDTRCRFADWLDTLAREGRISDALAHRATLED